MLPQKCLHEKESRYHSVQTSKFKDRDPDAKIFENYSEKEIFLVPLRYITKVSWTHIQCSSGCSSARLVFFNFEHSISNFCVLDDDDAEGSKSSLSVSRCVHPVIGSRIE